MSIPARAAAPAASPTSEPTPAPRDDATPSDPPADSASGMPGDDVAAVPPEGPAASATDLIEPGNGSAETSPPTTSADVPIGRDVGSVLDAQQAAANQLELDDAINIALRQHPTLQSVREQVVAAETRVGQAQSNYYPRIDGYLQYVRATENGSTVSMHSLPGLSRTGGARRAGVDWSDSFNNYFAGLIVRQVIYDFGRTKGSVDSRRAYVLAAKMAETLAEQDVIFGVMAAFYEVRAARESIALAEDTLEITLSILEYAEAARRTGLKPPSETARAEASVAAAEVDLIRAKARLQLALAQVANALGEFETRYEPAERSIAPGPVPSEAAGIELALANRPELKLFDYQRQGLDKSLSATKAQQYPRMDGYASVNSRGQFLPAADQDPYQQFNWNVGLVVNIPIFQGLLVRKQKEEIRAQMRGLDGTKEAVRQAVVLEVRQALAQVRAADAAAKASEKGVKAAKEALATLQGRYLEGLARLVELTDAQNAYVRARSQLVRATYDRYLARAILGLAMGRPRGV